jgi:hypothetical protein
MKAYMITVAENLSKQYQDGWQTYQENIKKQRSVILSYNYLRRLLQTVKRLPLDAASLFPLPCQI